jgi:glucosamine--fructose-6-phosphate aminotransferase (isomerizing)
MINDVMNLNYRVESLLENSVEMVRQMVENFNYEHLFILGKGILYPIACEASLKIKELSYIHSEAYSSSSLKHGPFALLDENFPVFILDRNDEHHSRNMNTLEEIECRNAPVYLFTNVKRNECPQHKNYHYIYVPNGGYYQPILTVIILQLFSYYLSLKRGCEIDMPRSLAKTVTTL